MKNLMMCGALVAAVAGAAYGGTTWYQSRPLRMAEAEIRKNLNDPESAQFDGVHSCTSRQGDLIVLGWFNAKNHFGGYAGRRPFRVAIDDQNRAFVIAPQFSAEIAQLEMESERQRAEEYEEQKRQGARCSEAMYRVFGLGMTDAEFDALADKTAQMVNDNR